MYALLFKNKKLFFIDQTKLPLHEVWRECKTLEQGYKAIKTLAVRGAPLIGVFAAYCLAIASQRFSNLSCKFVIEVHDAIAYLISCRPTAVNLSWALKRMEQVVDSHGGSGISQIKKMLLDQARKIHSEDMSLCRKIGVFGATLIKSGDSILTHCNAGFLATSGVGTALAPIYHAAKQGKRVHVYVDETRPLLQGARLTAWELTKAKVPCTLITDNMASYLMQKGEIDKVFVGADRIASNGDTANKIGTYSVAVNAHAHKIPFYVVAPFSTFDLSLSSGKEIPIEERDPDEVRTVLRKIAIAPKNVKVFNPAFDVTPHALVSAIVCDRGIIRPPYQENIPEVIR